jgi:hypothetical protein
MSRYRPKMPSPAFAVATVALIVAMAGTGYAAFKLPKNSVGTKQLKNGAVTTPKLKNGAITSVKIKNGAVNKSKLNLAGVTVPNASHANSANFATNATNATNAANAVHATTADSTNGVSTVSIHPTRTVDAAADVTSAPQVPLGSKGPFSFYGKCYLNGAGVEATTYIASTSNTGMFNTEAEDSGYVTPSTPENSRKLQDVVTPGANAFIAGDGDKDFNATDGTTSIYGVVGLAAAKQGSPAAGDGPFGPGNRCMFGEVIFG